MGERGSALTEFALVVPLFLGVLYGALYLTDLGLFKLRAQEVSRFGAWSFTGQPIAQMGQGSGRHQPFEQARGAVIDHMNGIYHDLDGANRRVAAGAWSNTMGAVYVPQAPTQVRNRPVEMVAEWANASWAEDLSVFGVILNVLGFATDVNGLVQRIGSTLGFNERGFVSVQSDVRVSFLPMGQQQAERSRAMARGGRLAGMDLSDWQPDGWQLRDAANQPIRSALVVDSWRVSDGASALPSFRNHPTSQVVDYIDHRTRVFQAIPGGTIVGAVAGLLLNPGELPMGLGNIFAVPPNRPAVHIFSRPYSTQRNRQPNHTGSKPEAGQVDIFRAVNRSPQENNAVRYFETAPLFTDPAHPEQGGFFESLNRRGPNFMGCPNVERRGCFE